MAPTPPRPVGPEREVALRTARLGSGLVMLAFIVMHLANHALLLVSLDAAETARRWFLAIWRNPVGTSVFYGAMLIHVALVLRSIYLRRTLVMPVREAVQTALGLLVPLLLAGHITGTRLFHELTGVDDTYEFVVRALWITTPWQGLSQAIALVVAWAHGCFGLHFWLRFRPWYPRAAPWLLIAAVLIPVLALLGFANAGQALETMDRVPLPPSVDLERIPWALAWVDTVETSVYAAFGAVLVALLALRALRQRRARLVEIRYETGQVVRAPKGGTVLEASRIGGVPHYSVCGGKGRCSTCRVRVLKGLEGLPAPGPVERATLARIAAEPEVRLACQLRPNHDLTVAPLLVAGGDRTFPLGSRQWKPGREQEIAVLFCDIRSFTALSDRRLPYDVVFLLNRYFAVVGKAVKKSGGTLDKFVGDGAMALFGLETSKQDGCRQAVAAAAAILRDLDRLSKNLGDEIPAPLRVAIGIHAGPAIVGAMGYGEVMGVTAIGDTVNIASRLEAAAKEFDAVLVISQAAASLSGLDLSPLEARTLEIRGSTRPLDVRVAKHGAALASPSPQATPEPAAPV